MEREIPSFRLSAAEWGAERDPTRTGLARVTLTPTHCISVFAIVQPRL